MTPWEIVGEVAGSLFGQGGVIDNLWYSEQEQMGDAVDLEEARAARDVARYQSEAAQATANAGLLAATAQADAIKIAALAGAAGVGVLALVWLMK